MIKITRKIKTIFLIMGTLVFPFLISVYLFPFQDSGNFCPPTMPPDTLWNCGYTPAMPLLYLSVHFFLIFILIAFLASIIWTLLKRKPKYVVFVLFSWLFFPFVCRLMLDILYHLFPYNGMYAESNYNFFIPTLWLMLFSLSWLLPILILFVKYKRKKIDKENLQNNIYQWLKWSVYLYVVYAVAFAVVIIDDPYFKLYFHML